MDNNRIDTGFLNGMRFLLAIYVGVVHFFNRAGSGVIVIPKKELLLNGGEAVDAFMVITGFLMAYNFTMRRNIENPKASKTRNLFWMRRFFRLYPIYVLAIIFGYFSFDNINTLTFDVNHYFYGTSKSSLTYGLDKEVDLLDFWSHLTFLHGFFPNLNMSIIGPAWSLSTEVQFYAIFPFLFVFLDKKRNIMTMLVLSALLYFFSIGLFGFWDKSGRIFDLGAPSWISYKLIYFMLGIILAKFKLGVISYKWLVLCIAIIVLFDRSILSKFVCSLITILMVSEDLRPYFPKLLNDALVKFKSFLSMKWGEWGADVSYSFYILHSPILSVGLYGAMMLSIDDKRYTAIIGFCIFMIITLTLSRILFLWVERPLLTIGRDICNRYKNRTLFVE